MSDFQREERYAVFKLRDLVETEKDALLRLANGINAQSIECVVVESDWPNYEHTWQTIERVSDGSYSDPYAEIEQLRAKTAYARFQGMLNEDDPAKRAVSVPVAWWDGDTSAAEDSFSFKSNRCYTIPLYTHPASADDSKHHAVMQAQMWAQEARTQKAIVKEIGEMVGCANDWEMVEAVRNALATLPPNEHGKNRYGLDMAYFRNLFNRELNRPLTDFRPDELARVLARASHTADSEVLKEREFHAASPQAVNVPEWQLEARRAFWAGIEIAECFNVVAIAPRWDEYIAKRKEDLSQYVTRAGDGDGSTPTNADVWIKCSDRLPNLGQRVILKSRGVVQNYMPVFDQGDDDLGMGDHFWDFEDVNKIDNPLVDFEKDCWMPKPKKEQSHD